MTKRIDVRSVRVISFLLSFVLAITLTACVKGSGSTSVPAPINYKAIGNGAVVALTSLRDSFQILVNAGKASQSEVDGLNQILVIASEANKALQETTFPPPTTSVLWEDIDILAHTAANVSGAFGASSGAVIGINLAVSVFESIRAAFGIGAPPGASAAPVPGSTPTERLKALQQHDQTIRKQAGR